MLTLQLLIVQLQDGEHKAKPPEMLGEKECLQLEPRSLIIIKQQYLVIITITVSNLKGVQLFTAYKTLFRFHYLLQSLHQPCQRHNLPRFYT